MNWLATPPWRLLLNPSRHHLPDGQRFEKGGREWSIINSSPDARRAATPGIQNLVIQKKKQEFPSGSSGGCRHEPVALHALWLVG